MQQTNIGNVYKGALSILLNIPFHPSIVDCYKHLQGGYILQMTKIVLEHLGSIQKLAQQLDMILQLILTTKKTITNEMKEVLELWIIATPKEEMKVISVMNRLDPIEELYDMYSEKEDTPRIVKLEDKGLDFVSDVKGPADSYMDL